MSFPLFPQARKVKLPSTDTLTEDKTDNWVPKFIDSWTMRQRKWLGARDAFFSLFSPGVTLDLLTWAGLLLGGQTDRKRRGTATQKRNQAEQRDSGFIHSKKRFKMEEFNLTRFYYSTENIRH